MGLIDCVIGRKARPACCEAEDTGSETQDAAGFRPADAHGNINKISRMSEGTEDDEEDDETRDPAVKFVIVDDFVAE